MPIAYGTCFKETDVEAFMKKLLTAFGGLRRTNKIASKFAANLRLLEDRLWKQLMAVLDGRRRNRDVGAERQAADFVADHFDGSGPKQSRKLLQSLGLKPQELAQDAYRLYERFRPDIPAGKKGWGAKGDLDMGLIAQLAKRQA